MYLFNLLVEYGVNNMWVFAITLMFMLIIPLNDLLLPHLFGQLVEKIRTNSGFMHTFVLIVIVLVMVHGGALLSDMHDSVNASQLTSFVRQSLLTTVFEKHSSSIDDVSIGHFLSTLLKLPNVLLTWFSKFKDHLIPSALVFVGAIVYFGVHDLLLGVILLVTCVLVGIIMVASPRTCMQSSVAKSQHFSALHDEVDDIIRNMLPIFTHGSVSDEFDRLKEYDSHYRAASQSTMMCAVRYKLMAMPLVIGFFMLFMYRSHHLVQTGRMTTATFVALLIITISMTNNLWWCVDIVRDIVYDSGFLADSNTTFSAMEATVSEPSSVHHDGPPPAGLGLDHASFTYPGSDPILTDVSLRFEADEVVAITGPVGSGKSTITKLLTKLQVPSQGDLYVDGRWYSDMTAQEVRTLIGYVPQQPVLFNRSVYENILYGTEGVTTADVDRLLEAVGMDREFEGLPDGLHTDVGKNGSKLSGGQRQLVWCLRTFLKKTRYVVMDEPTASLNEGSKNILFRLIAAVKKDKTIVIVTHDPSVLDHVQRVVALPGKKQIPITNESYH